MNVSSVSPEARNNFIAKFRSDNLIYIAKAKILVAYPVATEWTDYCEGNLALHVDNNGFLYLTVFDYDGTSILFSHELYKKFDKNYQKLSPQLYAFPSERCMIGILFALESEAKNMDSEINKVCPKSKKKSFKSMFSNSKKKKEIVISMPEDVGSKAGVQWDPENGYKVDGLMEDLPKEHIEFLIQQGYIKNPK